MYNCRSLQLTCSHQQPLLVSKTGNLRVMINYAVCVCLCVHMSQASCWFRHSLLLVFLPLPSLQSGRWLHIDHRSSYHITSVAIRSLRSHACYLIPCMVWITVPKVQALKARIQQRGGRNLSRWGLEGNLLVTEVVPVQGTVGFFLEMSGLCCMLCPLCPLCPLWGVATEVPITTDRTPLKLGAEMNLCYL